MTIYYIGKSGIPVIKKAHVSEIEWHRGIIRLYNLKGVFVCQERNEKMKKIKHYNINNIGEKVTIKGWVSKVRNLGGLVFIDLRNRSGIIQVVVRPENKYYNLANDLKSEYVNFRKKKRGERDAPPSCIGFGVGVGIGVGQNRCL